MTHEWLVVRKLGIRFWFGYCYVRLLGLLFVPDALDGVRNMVRKQLEAA